ncbi:MAG: hypothetical protein Q8P20_08705 [bacterium]|nr:hypothetical protein [bacterium]
MTEAEYNQYKLLVLSKSTSATIHKFNNLLGAMEIAINEYSKTKNRDWLKIASQARREINKALFT